MITELPDAPLRKPEFPVYREWLQAPGELEITIAKNTTEEDIQKFASTVAGGGENSGLVSAINAIVEQAQGETKTKPALLVSLPYYLKWRGNSVWRRKPSTPSSSQKRSRKPSSPRAKKNRYGLFLVRECLKCKTIEKDATKKKATAAVFRVPAYGEPSKTQSRGKKSVHDKQAEGEQGTRGGNCTCVNLEKGKRCRFCSNRLCPGHGNEAGYPGRLKANCTDCRGQRWMRRSKRKNANGEPTLKRRKAFSSLYEPIRAGVFFTDESLIKDVKDHLLTMHAEKYDNPANETGAPTQGATGGQTRVTPAKNSTATIAPSSDASKGPPSSNDTTSSPTQRQGNLALTSDAEPGLHETPSGPPSGTVLDVPKIRLEPLRVSSRPKSKGSFAWRMV
jgi:hypothetical protein